MMIQLNKLLITICGMLLSVSCFAQIVTVKGVNTVTYATVLTAPEKEKSYRAAQVAAVERYFAEKGEAESENFEAIQAKVEANLDKFILSTVVLNEQDQPGLRKYSITVKVELNVAKLNTTLRSSSVAGKTPGAEKSQMVYVFVAREVASVKSFDDRVVKREEVNLERSVAASKSIKTKEGESVKGNSVATNGSKNGTAKVALNQTINVETGGSTTRRSDDVGYKLLPMGNQKTSTTSVFSQAGFAVADPEFVLADSDLKAVNDDYSKGNDLAPSTIRAVVQSLRKSQVPYLVLATFDVNAPIQDQATGLQRVSVSVTGRVLDLTNGIPREVAAVPPVQYFGVGADNASAMTKALKDASIAAAKEVVSRLNAAGVH
ncbi:MAG: hypothetical protein K2P84_01510 [Undibacterium sp.]|nr:hypothetical protein [Undibacterium sp.]